MNRKKNKTPSRSSASGKLDVTFGDADWKSPAFETIRSFFASPEDLAQFVGFIRAILNEDSLLSEIMEQKALHPGILRYHFEQLGFLGASVDAVDQRVVLLRIDGELFAVQQIAGTSKAAVAALVEISGLADGTVLRVLDCKSFLKLWSQSTGNAPEDYDIDSSIQPYLRSLIKGTPLCLHGRQLKVDSILGQGLEGTVFRVCDAQTQKPFALKVSYKDLRELFNYWSSGLERIRRQRPRVLSYLCEFHSCEAGEKGSTLLMEYVPVVSLQSLGSGERLAKGLRLLADVVHSVQALHQADVCHGDLGVSNVFVRRRADGCDSALLIDPHPDVCNDFKAYQRKDRFGIAHILYWIVTGRQWPEGTYPYLLKVMANEHDPAEGETIFADPPLKTSDSDYANLHAAAIRCLCNTDTFEAMVDAIRATNDRLNRSLVATPGRAADGSLVTGKDIERKVARSLKPIGSGIFMPLFSLPSYFGKKKPGQRDYGMGDSGPMAREFVKRLRSMGQRFWLLLPIGPTDTGNCPYRTDSSFAINPTIISPDDLLADGWITQKELDRVLPTFESTDSVPLDNAEVFAYKQKLLALAFKRLRQKNKASWQKLYESFIGEEAEWLDAYALYKTIESHYPTRWTGWPEALRDADPKALESFAEQHSEAIEAEKFNQFLAQHYFLQLRRFAEEHAIYMIGDMPAYSMHGSADVWAYRQAFQLTEVGERTQVAGAPPDVFDAQGQGWNHPMYRWSDPATLQFLKRKYLRMKCLFAEGFVRDDHIIGKVTPWGYTFSQPPAEGHRVTGTFLGNPLFDALLEAIPDLSTFLIGEDLGILTAETKRVMEHYGFMGMKVLQFMPFNDGPEAIAGHMYTPGNYPEETVMLLGTHDAPVIRDWWWQSLNESGRYYFSEYLSQHLEMTGAVTDGTVAALFTELAMKQSAHMVIHQVPDIIVNRDGSVGLSNARMNDPANHRNPRKNWSWRLRPDALEKQTMENLKQLTESANRTPATAIRRLKRLWPADAVVQLVANSLQAFEKAGKALAQQLEPLLEKGQVRYASLSPDCLSAVYQHSDGELYLLLSTECTNLEEQAVSLIRGLEVYMRQKNPTRKPLLKDLDDEALIGVARAAIDEIEQSLRCLVCLSSDDLREAMIAFMGSLFDLSGTDDPAIRKRLKAIGLSADESLALANRFQSVWTDLWVTYEQRDADRRNIIAGILTGELHGTKVSLRELRWRLAKAYAEELSAVEERMEQWKQSIASWAESLDTKATKRCLFGAADQIFEHSLDAYGKAEGLSGLLGLMRKVHRKEQKTADYSSRFREYARSLVRSSVRRQSADKKKVISLLTDVESDDSLKCLLELIEHCLITRLGALKPSRSSVSPEFPAEIDTQVHSYYSDCGGQSVARIVFEAYDRGLKAIAITDHQCFGGVEQALEIGQLFGVRVIPAVELYAGIKRAGRVEQRRDVLVYFPEVPRFLDWWKQGLDADTWQLFNDGWNRKLNGSKWGDVPIRRVTDWARAHGGVPVLAHPGIWSRERFHEDNWSFDAFEQLFRETGLAGIEISHSRLPFEENTKRFVSLVEQFNRQHTERSIVFTMGTDSHTTEGIGRANLTEEAITYIARAFAPAGPAGPAVRTKIVDSLEDAARRIKENMPLYRLREEVLKDAYAGFQACDRPLSVQRTDADRTSDTILAAIKKYKGQLVIITVNTGRREQFAGKDWGALDLAGAVTIQNDSKAVYRFKDLITGEQYERTGAELVAKGLHVGLLPNATQFLSLS